MPTTLKPDGRSRPPHLRSWRDGWRHLRFLLPSARGGCSCTRRCSLGVVGAAVFTRPAVGPVTIGSVTLPDIQR